jgi:hypothetical protein
MMVSENVSMEQVERLQRTPAVLSHVSLSQHSCFRHSSRGVLICFHHTQVEIQSSEALEYCLGSLEISIDRARENIPILAKIGATQSGGVTRFALAAEDPRARGFVIDQMRIRLCLLAHI